MTASVSERLQDVAAVIERLGIDQDRILAAEVVERDSGRVHVESPEFLAKIQGPYQRRPICDGDREIVTYRLWIYHYDESHTGDDLDSLPTVTAEDHTGADLSAGLGAVAKQAASSGIYYVDYTVSSADNTGGVIFKVDATEEGTTTQYVTTTVVVDSLAVERWLIGRAGAIMVSRLEGVVKTASAPSYETILKELAIIDHLDKPTIELRAQVRYMSSEYKWLAMRVNKMGLPLSATVTIDGYNPQSHPIPLPYDSENPAGIFNCYLQHPASVWHDMPGGVFPGQVSLNSQNNGASDSQSQAHEYPEGEPLSMTPSVLSDSEEIYTYPYTSYSLTNKYVTDHGYAQLPLAGPQGSPSGDTCAIVRLHAGVCKRVLAIEAVRAGKHPTLPTLAQELVDPNGIREVLVSTEIDTSAPQIEADQASRSFAIRAIYTYALSRPPTAEEKLRAGSIPMDSTDPDANAVLLPSAVDGAAHLQWEPPT